TAARTFENLREHLGRPRLAHPAEINSCRPKFNLHLTISASGSLAWRTTVAGPPGATPTSAAQPSTSAKAASGSASANVAATTLTEIRTGAIPTTVSPPSR